MTDLRREMELCITAEELRKAIAEIEQAEAHGFMHCLAVLKLASAGNRISECRVVYSDLLERGHETDGRLNWGRFQGVTKRNRLVKGELVSLRCGVQGPRGRCTLLADHDGLHHTQGRYAW